TWAWSQPFDRHQPPYVFGIDAGIAERDVPAEGMGDDRDGRQLLLMDQLREVIEVIRHCVMARGGPGGIAVAAQVRGDDVIVVAQGRGDPVPVAAMVPPAMQ